MNKRRSVSVIMPVRNEGAFIERSLAAVLAQDYPPELLEVLVVDGMSDDGTREAVANIITNGPSEPVVRLFDNRQGIVPAALNIGLAEATGDVVVRVDGHCEIAPDYVSTCVKTLQQTGADNVGGVQRAVGDGRTGTAIALATSSRFGAGNAYFRFSNKARWTDTVYLGAYRREVLERLGGFDEELIRNQDDELNLRLTLAGGRIWLDPRIKSEYRSRANFRKLWRQYFEYGFYKVRVIQKHRRVPSIRQLAPPALVSALIAASVVSLGTRKKAPAFLVAAPYIAGNALASVSAGRRNPASLPYLPVSYAVLHLAYGSGFLWGLWRWRDRWRDGSRT